MRRAAGDYCVRFCLTTEQATKNEYIRTKLTNVPATQEIIYNRARRDDGTVIAEVALNRPDKGNALNPRMLGRLLEIFRRMRGRPRGARRCNAGAWASLLRRRRHRSLGRADAPPDGAEWILPGVQVLSALAVLFRPIDRHRGVPIGGGLELAMAADLRIAHRDAKFSLPETGLGMISGWGGVRRVSELIGVAPSPSHDAPGTARDRSTGSRLGARHRCRRRQRRPGRLPRCVVSETLCQFSGGGG